MPNLANIIGYFRACYQADQRENMIWNIFDKKKVEQLHFGDSKENLLNGDIPYEFISAETAQEIQKILQVYQKEKELYYYAFFITGKSENDESAKRIIAPLLYYPARVFKREDKEDYIAIDFDSLQINFPLLNALNTSDNKNYEQEISSLLQNESINFPTLQELIKILEKYLTEVDFSQAYRYPEEMFDEKTLKKEAKQDKLQFLPSTCIGIMQSSQNTRGVLNELSDMQEQEEVSQVISTLFEENIISEAEGYKASTLLVPAVLSLAQQGALHNAYNESLSVVIGPPGTGKSYTIATLAIDQIHHGKTVLIASKNNEAVDVIAEKIEKQLGIEGIVVRGGRKTYLNNLKKYLENILQGIGIIPSTELAQSQTKANNIYQVISEIDQEIKQLEQRFHERSQTELKHANYLRKHQNPSFWMRLFVNWKKSRIKQHSLSRAPHWDLITDLEKKLATRNNLLSQYIELKHAIRVRMSLMKNRRELQTFLKAIKTRRDSQQQKLFEKIDFKVILDTFPIWLVNLNDIYNILPLRKDLFDVALIDEASQCDIASSLPILQRAQKSIVVGDSKQLRHISFLSRLRQSQLQKDFDLENYEEEKLDYRETSLLDLAQNNIHKQNALVFLNEHYRSLPEIIAFSNEHFYRNSLHVMKQHFSDKKKQTLRYIHLEGERNSRGENETEAAYILTEIQKIIKKEADFSQEICRSIGILSPFRKQVDYLSTLITENIALSDMQKHNIMLGTAHSFQGNERDIMFLSFVVDPITSAGSFTHLNKPDLFNVSITRARNRQYVVTSVDAKNLKAGTYLQQYLDNSVNEQKSLSSSPNIAELDDFIKDVRKTLGKMKFKTFVSYPLAGIEIDLVIKQKDRMLGIDLIGYAGENFEDAFALERYKMLHRADLHVLPIPYTLWLFDTKRCLQEIEARFK